MKQMSAIGLAAILLVALLTFGCGGGGGGSVIPEDNTPPPNNPPPGDNPPPADNPPPGSPAPGRQLWGMWNVNFDETSLTATATPVAGVDSYFTGLDGELLAASANAVSVEVNFFDPASRVLDLDVNVANPHANTAYDVRAVVYTDDAGHEVRNPEGWTETFDIPGGRDANPFKVYAKEDESRKFVPSMAYDESYKVQVPVSEDSGSITIAVDGAWYENQAEPVYALKNFRQTEIYDDDESLSEIFIDINDPNGTLDRVTIEADEITGEYITELSKYSGNTWRGVLKNGNQMPVGDYEVKIEASAYGSDAIVIHDYVVLEVVKDHGWVRTWGGIYGGDIDAPVLGDRARDVATDSFGNVLVTGMFNDIADFDPGIGDEVRTSNGDFDIYLAKFDSGGNLMWVNTWGGPAGEFGDSVACDGGGNIYVTGRFLGTVDFDPGPGTDFRTANGKDVFLCLFYPSGEFRGVFTWGGPGDDYGYAIEVDNFSNVYIAGNFEGTADFDPGPGTDYHTGNAGDVFVVKFDTHGFFQWARTWGGPEWDFAESLDVDDFGNVYITGNINGTVDLNPGIGVDLHTAVDFWDVFLVVLDSSGNYRWGITFGGDGWDYGYAVAADKFGDIYVAGDFQYTVDFDPGPGTYEIEIGFEHYAYLSKFDSSGNFLWVTTQGGVVIPDEPPPAEDDWWDDWNDWDDWWNDWDDDWWDWGGNSDPILDLAIDQDNNVYSVGWYEGVVDFPDPGGGIIPSTGGRDGFVAKYTSSGGCEWVRNIGGPSRDEGFGVAIDDRGNVYAAGFFWDTVDFNPGAGTTNRTSNGYDDIWLIKFLPNGDW